MCKSSGWSKCFIATSINTMHKACLVIVFHCLQWESFLNTAFLASTESNDVCLVFSWCIVGGWLHWHITQNSQVFWEIVFIIILFQDPVQNSVFCYTPCFEGSSSSSAAHPPDFFKNHMDTLWLQTNLWVSCYKVCLGLSLCLVLQWTINFLYGKNVQKVKLVAIDIGCKSQKLNFYCSNVEMVLSVLKYFLT